MLWQLTSLKKKVIQLALASHSTLSLSFMLSFYVACDIKKHFFPQDIRRKQQGEIMARKGEKAIDLPSLKMQVMISKKKKRVGISYFQLPINFLFFLMYISNYNNIFSRQMHFWFSGYCTRTSSSSSS